MTGENASHSSLLIGRINYALSHFYKVQNTEKLQLYLVKVRSLVIDNYQGAAIGAKLQVICLNCIKKVHELNTKHDYSISNVPG